MRIEEVDFANTETVFLFLLKECGYDPDDVEISMAGMAEITVKVKTNLGDKTEVQTILVEAGDTFAEACLRARRALGRYYAKMFIDSFLIDMSDDVKVEYDKYDNCFNQRGTLAIFANEAITNIDHFLERIDCLVKGLNNLRYCVVEEKREIEGKLYG